MAVTGTVPSAVPGVKVSTRGNLERLALTSLEIAALADAVGKAVAAGKLR